MESALISEDGFITKLIRLSGKDLDNLKFVLRILNYLIKLLNDEHGEISEEDRKTDAIKKLIIKLADIICIGVPILVEHIQCHRNETELLHGICLLVLEAGSLLNPNWSNNAKSQNPEKPEYNNLKNSVGLTKIVNSEVLYKISVLISLFYEQDKSFFSIHTSLASRWYKFKNKEEKSSINVPYFICWLACLSNMPVEPIGTLLRQIISSNTIT